MSSASRVLTISSAIDLGTLIDTCEVTTGWTGSGSTITAHTGNNRLSGRSASVQIQNSGTGTLFNTKAGLLAAQTVDAEWITYGALVYNARAYDTVTSGALPDMRLDIRTTGGAKTGVANDTSVLRHGWNWVQNSRWNTPSSNGFTIADDAITEFMLRCSGNATLAYDAYVSGLYRNPKPILALMWHIDDVWQTGYDAFNTLCYEPYGWPVTLNVAKSLVNPLQANTMTLAGLKAAIALGHQIANHSADHANMDTYNAADFLADLEENVTYCIENGLYAQDTANNPHEGLRQYVSPFGRMSQSNIDVLRLNGYTFGFSSSPLSYDSSIADAINPFGGATRVYLDAATNEATVRSVFAKARAHRSPIRVVTHGANSEGGASCTPQVFRVAVEEARRCVAAGYEPMREIDYRRKLGPVPTWWLP